MKSEQKRKNKPTLFWATGLVEALFASEDGKATSFGGKPDGSFGTVSFAEYSAEEGSSFGAVDAVELFSQGFGVGPLGLECLKYIVGEIIRIIMQIIIIIIIIIIQNTNANIVTNAPSTFLWDFCSNYKAILSVLNFILKW